MSIVVLFLFLFTVGVFSLILYVSFKAFQKASIRNKKDRLKLVDEQYEEVVLIKKEFKDTNKKEKEVKKFTNN